MKHPQVKIGIMTAPEISVTFSGEFVTADGATVTGRHTFDASENMMLRPVSSDCSFTLHDVVIGKSFHWQRSEDQAFAGSLQLLPDDGKLVAINHMDVEEYLLSVISSEMSARSSLTLLCVHAIISRSWLMSQMQHKKVGYEGCCSVGPDEIVKWYDHDDHQLFDVCADDHCQRYQGLGRVTTPAVAEALKLTEGLVLSFEGEICDARFSKCCGGVTEEFATCWQPVNLPYLRAFRDAGGNPAMPNLSVESEARSWILSDPGSFCRDPQPEVLMQVLNDYDREDTDFYRWSVVYSAETLAALVAERLGRNLGLIRALTPLHRGPSGRIDRLRIDATMGSVVIGKELVIRRTLSPTHLKSSAFVADPSEELFHDVPARWTLRGAGWGHGVGLCQIGAAVMAERGYSYDDILNHYFPGAKITKLY